jgi:D-alanyl-D-alanine endopeptidase (penicillin-binding protein 7)
MRKIIILFLMVLSAQVASAQAGAYGLFDYSSSTYLVRYNHTEIRSIASITKLFTAVTVLRSGVSLDEKIQVNGKSSGHVQRGVYMSRMDLMRAMIITSDNRAAETLANHHPGGFNKFLIDTNAYIENNSMFETTIVDSTGLKPGNKSTARDLIEFLNQIKNNTVIRAIANERNMVLNVPRGKKTITINLHNTNPDLFVYDNILISKTGFTNPAGRCVIMLVEKGKDLFGVVVLGQSNIKNRSKVVGELLSMDVEPTPSPKITVTVEFEFSPPL